MVLNQKGHFGCFVGHHKEAIASFVVRSRGLYLFQTMRFLQLYAHDFARAIKVT